MYVHIYIYIYTYIWPAEAHGPDAFGPLGSLPRAPRSASPAQRLGACKVGELGSAPNTFVNPQ